MVLKPKTPFQVIMLNTFLNMVIKLQEILNKFNKSDLIMELQITLQSIDYLHIFYINYIYLSNINIDLTLSNAKIY